MKEEHTEPYTISSIASTSASLLFTARAGAGGLEVKSAAVAVAIFYMWYGGACSVIGETTKMRYVALTIPNFVCQQFEHTPQ